MWQHALKLKHTHRHPLHINHSTKWGEININYQFFQNKSVQTTVCVCVCRKRDRRQKYDQCHRESVRNAHRLHRFLQPLLSPSTANWIHKSYVRASVCSRITIYCASIWPADGTDIRTHKYSAIAADFVEKSQSFTILCASQPARDAFADLFRAFVCVRIQSIKTHWRETLVAACVHFRIQWKRTLILLTLN